MAWVTGISVKKTGNGMLGIIVFPSRPYILGTPERKLFPGFGKPLLLGGLVMAFNALSEEMPRKNAKKAPPKWGVYKTSFSFLTCPLRGFLRPF